MKKNVIIDIVGDSCDAQGEGESAWDAKLQGAHGALYALHWVHSALHMVYCALHWVHCALHWVHCSLHMVHPSFLETATDADDCYTSYIVDGEDDEYKHSICPILMRVFITCCADYGINNCDCGEYRSQRLF